MFLVWPGYMVSDQSECQPFSRFQRGNFSDVFREISFQNIFAVLRHGLRIPEVLQQRKKNNRVHPDMKQSLKGLLLTGLLLTLAI